MDKKKLKELKKRIDEVLFYVWDPLGVSDNAGVRGEYSRYVMTIMKWILEEDEKQLVQQLDSIESESMGLITKRTRNQEIAEYLMDCKHAIEEGLK